VMTGGGAERCGGAFVAGATAAEAPVAIARDIPAAPHTGKALLKRFCFETCFVRAIVESPGLRETRRK
jgi:hypothetical protein